MMSSMKLRFPHDDDDEGADDDPMSDDDDGILSFLNVSSESEKKICLTKLPI